MTTAAVTRSSSRCAALFTAILVLNTAVPGQTNAQTAPIPIVSQDAKSFSGLAAEFSRILQKTHESVPSPATRTQSRLLLLLPESTIFYAAFPNYGEASHQFVTVFQNELKTNASLRSWWESGDMAAQRPKLEASLQRFYELSQYLGDEVVVCGVKRGKLSPAVLVLAEVRKPGLKVFLQQSAKELGTPSAPAARVLDAAELASTRDLLPIDKPAIMVLPDMVVGASDISALREFSAAAKNKNHEFLATGFGQRLARSYAGGLTMLVGIDVHTIMADMPTQQGRAIFESTGFSDAKYLVWERGNISNQPASQMELSFIGPRRGVASWLAAPGPMHSLDFVSPKAAIATAVRLKDPAKIFDDVRDLASASNPNAMASLEQMERALRISLRDDLLSHLGGELALEVNRFTPPDPEWKLILQTKDPDAFLAKLRTLLTVLHMPPVDVDQDGVTYHVIQIPSAQKAQQIVYVSVDGYLIVGPSQRSIAQAIRLHRSGESLAANRKFQEALPLGRLAETSAVLYEDPIALAELSLRRFSPELAQSLSKQTVDTPPVVICGYGDESALREVSRNEGVDVSATLIIAAIAVPNLLRARSAANEASAAGMVRTAITAQVMYETSFPQKGYARSLAELGPDPNRANQSSPQHAALIDSTLGNTTCGAGTWCTKSGYRFMITTNCRVQQRCREYVVTATPVSASTGSKNFCAISDGLVRVQSGAPLSAPLAAAECSSWNLLQ